MAKPKVIDPREWQLSIKVQKYFRSNAKYQNLGRSDNKKAKQKKKNVNWDVMSQDRRLIFTICLVCSKLFVSAPTIYTRTRIGKSRTVAIIIIIVYSEATNCTGPPTKLQPKSKYIHKTYNYFCLQCAANAISYSQSLDLLFSYFSSNAWLGTGISVL